MKKEHIQEIIHCLPDDRTLFHYHKDRYALWLLSSHAGKGCSIGQLKQSPFARLLNKPLIKELMANHGRAQVCAEDFTYSWSEPSTTFMLTLDSWGGRSQAYDQTTRGDYNLVLQLNFSNQHNDFFHRRISKGWQDDLRSFSHPVLDKDKRRFKHETLAWSRMDIDLERGEALIEEIQNDWLRYAKRWQRCASKQFACAACPIKDQKDQVSFYLEHILKPYYNIWAEAMLAATLWFLHVELGINRIFYHDYATGCQLKKITGRKPPRSIYTDLPRQFCFKQTTQAPEFLLQDKRFSKRLKKLSRSPLHWQALHLEQSHAWA